VCEPLLKTLELAPFRQRFPWLGPDLQTVRNTLRAPKPLPEHGQCLEFSLPGGDRLLARFDPPTVGEPRGLVVVVHGLGGGSDDEGQRRLGRALNRGFFAVLRLNLRGAGPGRPLARGTYAACCAADLLPVLHECRLLAADLAPGRRGLPLGAVGLSLGGTVLLNALLASRSSPIPLLDGLVCISSPLDLAHCADRFEHPRNRLYQSWLLPRLIQQTLADPHGLSEEERQGLIGPRRPHTIRAFDDLITAPRWGFPDVLAYYQACSPLQRLRQVPLGLPPLLVVHSKDDPWVPVASALSLAQEVERLQRRGTPGAGTLPEVLITERGGHNGFHAPGDSADGCWSDRLASLWLARALGARPST
jgi:predicted alpha/beta-fold hydrolase